MNRVLIKGSASVTVDNHISSLLSGPLSWKNPETSKFELIGVASFTVANPMGKLHISEAVA